MRKYHIVLAIVSLFAAQQSFANESMQASTNDDMPVVTQCKMIAKACVSAGYTKPATDKAFWRDCMKPVLLNQTVKGVTLDAKDVAACRQAKIAKMESELEALKAVK